MENDKNKIQSETGEPDKLIEDQKVLRITVTNSAGDLSGKMEKAFPDFECRDEPGNQLLVHSRDTISIGPVVRFIEEQGAEVTEARQLKPSLEEVFVRLTGIEPELMKKEKNGDQV